MERYPRGISIEDVARIRETMHEFGSEIRRFRSDLESYQSEVRRALILHGDATVQGAGGSAP